MMFEEDSKLSIVQFSLMHNKNENKFCSLNRLIIHRCESDISLAKRKPLVASFPAEKFSNTLSVTSLRAPSPPKTPSNLKNGMI